MKWQYYSKTWDMRPWQTELDKLGAERWELISMTLIMPKYSTSYWVGFFKRPVVEK